MMKQVFKIFCYLIFCVFLMPIVVNAQPIGPPRVTVSPTFGGVFTGTQVIIEANDPNGVQTISYSWIDDDLILESETVSNQNIVFTNVPTRSAEDIKLTIKVMSNSGYATSINCHYTVAEKDYFTRHLDNHPPTVTVYPSAGALASGEEIEIKASDLNGIRQTGYTWKDQTSTMFSEDFTSAVAPTESLPYFDIKVLAMDNSADFNLTGWYSFRFYNLEMYTDIIKDKSPPIVNVEPSGGTVYIGDTITLTAEDPSGIKDIYYAWNGKEKVPCQGNPVYIPVEQTMLGENFLRFTVTDDSPNKNATPWGVYKYNVAKKPDYALWASTIAAVVALATCTLMIKYRKEDKAASASRKDETQTSSIDGNE